jgi:HD-GYP domain-containing protein (c-di-GMP phosphodiesterase class II)
MSGSVVVIRGAVTTHQPPLALARRVVPPLVDTLMKREYSILGFAALMNHDAYTHAHCVNVSLLSIAIGRLLGLARTDLANLGVAALLHDVGKLNVPAEILCKAGKLSP